MSVRTGCRPGRAAGFLAPLDDVAPAGRARRSEDGHRRLRAHRHDLQGKLYGLPYYADTISFIYNKKILEDAGIAVPTTWDEVTAAAEKLKAGGMEHPIVYEYDQELPNFFDAFVAQAYGRGGDLFDADLQGRSSTTRTTPPTSSCSGWPTPSRRTSCSRRRTNRRSSRR